MEAILEATTRDTLGKNAARRTRRDNKVPAALYCVDADISNLMLHQGVRVRDVATNAKWKSVSDADMMLVHVILPKAEEAPAATTEAAAAPVAAAEPEVIKKGKKEEEAEAKEEKKK